MLKFKGISKMLNEHEISADNSISDDFEDVSYFSVPSIGTEDSHDLIIAEAIAENLQKVIQKDQERSIPLFLNIKRDFIKRIAKKVVSHPNKRLVIGVTGESASGKTTLAENTVKACAPDKPNIYTLITGDDYFHDWSKELKDAGSFEALFERGYNFDIPDAVNLDLMRSHILELANGNSVFSPEYSFVSCESKPNGKLKQPAKVILNEGIFALNPKLRDVLDIAIYVYTPHDIIKDRWYKRAASRGKIGKAADMHFEKVNREADKHVRPTMKTSDIIVNGLTSSEYIEFIADEIVTAINDAIN